MDPVSFQRAFDRIVDNVTRVVHGKEDVVRLVVAAVCARGHVLIEDVPGVGKSVLARAVAQSIDGRLTRVQCTPDLLPADVTGSTVVDLTTNEFVFRPGPVFANVVLVDEINRATPKTQSALLEAMAEGRVSVDGTSRQLPVPFVVIATQNPVELAGTYPLPEAQLDRFLFKLAVGYPDAEAEVAVVRDNAAGLAVDGVEPVADCAIVSAMADAAAAVSVSPAVETYLVELCRATRDDTAVALGASPRASIALLRGAKVLAAADGRSSVYPDDVAALVRPVMSHRVVLRPEAILRGDTVDAAIERAVARVPTPLGLAMPSDVTGPADIGAGAGRLRRRVGARR